MTLAGSQLKSKIKNQTGAAAFTRSAPAGHRDFKKKMMRADHRRLPFSISVDKNAAYPEAFITSQVERIALKDCTRLKIIFATLPMRLR
jgi:acetyl-CoA carboxylase alpha subunit